MDVAPMFSSSRCSFVVPGIPERRFRHLFEVLGPAVCATLTALAVKFESKLSGN